MARRRKKGILGRWISSEVKAYQRRKRARKTAQRAELAKNRRASETAQRQIQRESRTTAGELRKSGKFQWAGSGMPDSTIMEPVRTKDGWEWHPAKQQKPKTQPGSHVQRPPAVPGMKAVRQGNGWAYQPIIARTAHDIVHTPEPRIHQGVVPMDTGRTTARQVRALGFGSSLDDRVPDDQELMVYSDGAIHIVRRPGDGNGDLFDQIQADLILAKEDRLAAEADPDGYARRHAEAEMGAVPCGAPTRDGTPCEHLGACPIPKHKQWRRGQGRG